MKRTASVPKGLVRFLVLKFLAEKAMSGAEIVEVIKKETSGKWKPSPGSIYPLLAWLQDKGYTSEASSMENGMKRYVLTEKGEEFFQEQVKFGQAFLEKLQWLAPMLIGGFHFGTNHENLLCAKESAKRLLETFIEFQIIKDSLTKQDVGEIVEILDNSDRQLKKIARRVKEKKPV